MFVSLIMIPFIKEIRKTEKFDSEKALKNLEKRIMHSIFGIYHNGLMIKKTHYHKKH